MNVGAGRKKDCLKKLAAIPILLRSADGISKIGWSVKWNEHETRKTLVLYRKMGGMDGSSYTQYTDGATFAS